MVRIIKQSYLWFRNGDKKRTLNLTLFLALLIIMPLIFAAPANKHITQQNAAGTPGTTALAIYGTGATVGDTIATGWTAKVWYGGPTAVNLTNKAPVYAGVNSIAYTVTAPFDELDLIAPQPFDITPYNYLTFYGQVPANGVGQKFGVVLIGTNGKPNASPAVEVPMEQYGGPLTSSYWTTYNIPISAFNAPSKTILGVGFQDLNGGTQNIQPPPPVYLDEIGFSAAQGVNTTPTPQIGPPPTATPLPTPVPPYYPDISPWVYIIPGIIILIAIIFQ